MTKKKLKAKYRSEQNKEFKDRSRILNRQQKAANTVSKYGAKRRPAPIVVKSLETGEVLRVHDSGHVKSRIGNHSEWLDQKAREAGYESYSDYLKSPHWLEFRERALNAANYRCWKCKEAKSLTVHHNHYNTLGRERVTDVKTLCFGCHKKLHGKMGA
jgi:hypothetical protein